MRSVKEAPKPTKREQQAARESYLALETALQSLHSEAPEIEIEETEEKIKVPLRALQLLVSILRETSQGRPVSIVPIAAEMTTQAAAELLGCSRPHVIKLLDQGEIEFTKVGKHRRLKYEDVMDYKKRMKGKQKELIIEMMKSDEELGLYDT